MGFQITLIASVAPVHGPLIVLGVFQGVIALERAVALGRRWAYLAPVLAAIGGALAVARIDSAPWLLVAAAAVLVAVNLAVIRRQSAVFTWLMLLGALVLLVGAVAWAEEFATSRVVPSWIAFFVLTIVAERLELSRMVRTPRWASLAVGALCLMLAAGAISTLVDEDTPAIAIGVPLALLGVWVLGFDAARRTVRQPGLPRFAGIGVLAGAAWLVVAGLESRDLRSAARRAALRRGCARGNGRLRARHGVRTRADHSAGCRSRARDVSPRSVRAARTASRHVVAPPGRRSVRFRVASTSRRSGQCAVATGFRRGGDDRQSAREWSVGAVASRASELRSGTSGGSRCSCRERLRVDASIAADPWRSMLPRA